MQGSFTTTSSRLFVIGAFFVSFFLHVAAFAQNRNITGKVTDVSNKGIAGATLQIEGTKRYTTTDATGNFSIQSTATNEVLLISYTGFLTQKINVGNKSTINVTLVEDAKLLNDVVVIGYGAVKGVM